MNIIIIGAGSVGRELAHRLSGEGHSIIVIDNDRKTLELAIESCDVKGVYGNGASSEIQTEAGVANADLLISCTSKDEVNILCGLVGKKLGVKDTIARVRNPEYFSLFIGRELGLSEMVNPEYEVAKEISRMLKYPKTIKIEPFFDGKINLIEIKISKDSPLADILLKNIYAKLGIKLLVCIVRRGEEIYIPSGNFQLLIDDKIFITADETNLLSFLKLSKMMKPARKILVVGGGRITFYLLKELVKLRMHIKVIEISEEKSQALDEQTHGVEVINGDGTNHDLLIEEGLETMDAFVALAGRDEQNILVSLFANTRGINKIITKIDDVSYMKLLESSGIESIISTKATTANEIIRYVREKENSFGSSIKKLYRSLNNRAEIVEFLATSSFKAISVPLSAVSTRHNALVVGILRNGNAITPCGTDTIEIGDNVIVVVADEVVDDLNDILE
ncbi:MAG: Trk system potassium transporter TrkA [Christensenellaceae bacterium]|nr:Trk system potassium transporter TrkA [Christensenellaceae bacterium]